MSELYGIARRSVYRASKDFLKPRVVHRTDHGKPPAGKCPAYSVANRLPKRYKYSCPSYSDFTRMCSFKPCALLPSGPLNMPLIP